MKQLVIFDLDGTLLGDDRKVPEEIFSLVPALAKTGIKFVAASGRSPYTLRENFLPVADCIDYVCDNGAVAVADGKIVLSKPLKKEIVRETVSFCEREEVYPLLCGSKITYLLPVKNEKSEAHIKRCYHKLAFVQTLNEIDDDINKIAICDLKNPKSGSFDKLCEVLGGRADAVVSGEVWMDVMCLGVNKGDGLKAIQEYYGIKKEETVAFGDFYNDIPLLERAKYAYVMKNANKDMYAFGNRLAESNNDGGVIKVLKQILDNSFEN